MRHTPRSTRGAVAASVAAALALLLGACTADAGDADAGDAEAGDAEMQAGDEVEVPTIDRLNIIVPADPGGGWDQTGRAIQSVLQDNDLVADAQVVNVGGAGGTVGLAQLATTRDPDTLMVMGFVMVGAVETNAAQTTLEDVTPIARLTEEPLIVVVPAGSPYETIQDLVEDIQARGQAVSVTGGSAGGVDHILAAQLLTEAGVPAEDVAGTLNYIPYSGGGESLAALLGSNVDAGISGVGEYAEQVKAGTLRALAVSGPDRSAALPEVPNLVEEGIDLTLTNWRGVVAPGNIDEAQADALTALIDGLHGTADWGEVLEANQWADAILLGDEFATFLQDDVRAVRQTLLDIGLIQ